MTEHTKPPGEAIIPEDMKEKKTLTVYALVITLLCMSHAVKDFKESDWVWLTLFGFFSLVWLGTTIKHFKSIAAILLLLVFGFLTSCTKTVQKTPTPVQNIPTSVQKIKITYKLSAGHYPCNQTRFYPDSIGGQTTTTSTTSTTTFYLNPATYTRMASISGSIPTNDSVFTWLWINDTLRASGKGANVSTSTVYF